MAAVIFGVFVVYNVYQYIYIPWSTRRRFAKYENVHMNEQNPIILGDAVKYMEDIKQGRVNFYHQIEYSLELQNKDIRVSCVANNVFINLFSLKSVKEFVKKCPKYIDRHSLSHTSFGKLFPSAFMHLLSNNHWKFRRESALKEIGINFSSKFIPSMIDSIGI